MKTFKFGTTLRYVLELFIVSALFLLIIKGSFLLLNLASTVGNITGMGLFLITIVSYVYYIGNYVRRIHEHLNDKL